jgi:hypothetical protein
MSEGKQGFSTSNGSKKRPFWLKNAKFFFQWKFEK